MDLIYLNPQFSSNACYNVPYKGADGDERLDQFLTLNENCNCGKRLEMNSKLEYESEIINAIHEVSNTAKHECFFVGFLSGVVANHRIDETELEPLLAACASICMRVGDDDAAEIIAEASAGHHDTPKELLALLTQIAEVRSKNINNSCKRSSANRILGFCAGINCDGIITTKEAAVLSEALVANHDLSDDPRIVALRTVLKDALEDGLVDPAESEEISRLISTLVGDSYAHTGIPSSEALPVIHDLDLLEDGFLEGRTVVLTGGFRFGTRREVTARLEEHGATVQSAPSRKTEVVIIGSEASINWTHRSHGGKLAKALSIRADGPAPRIYVEAQLIEILK